MLGRQLRSAMQNTKKIQHYKRFGYRYFVVSIYCNLENIFLTSVSQTDLVSATVIVIHAHSATSTALCTVKDLRRF